MKNLDNPNEKEFHAEVIETKIVFTTDGNGSYVKHRIRCDGKDYRFISYGALQPLTELETL